MREKIGSDVVKKKAGGKLDRVSPLESFNVAKRPGELTESATLRLSNIFRSTRKNISEAQSDMEIMDTLMNMDAEIKDFRDKFYPKMTQEQRLDNEEIIRDMVKNLESYAKQKMRYVKRETLEM